MLGADTHNGCHQREKLTYKTLSGEEIALKRNSKGGGKTLRLPHLGSLGYKRGQREFLSGGEKQGFTWQEKPNVLSTD